MREVVGSPTWEAWFGFLPLAFSLAQPGYGEHLGIEPQGRGYFSLPYPLSL